jgi:hypothetical protein
MPLNNARKYWRHNQPAAKPALPRKPFLTYPIVEQNPLKVFQGILLYKISGSEFQYDNAVYYPNRWTCIQTNLNKRSLQMKYKAWILIGTVVASLFISFSFGAGQALATTGCFTDTIGHPWETYICWMKDNGITNGTTPTTYSPNGNVTRGQMAVFMQRQAEIPPTTGPIYISTGLNDWMENGSSGINYVNLYTDAVNLRSTAAGIYGFQITPDVPATLYGRQMYANGVKLCYDATLGATLTSVYLRHYAGGGNPTIYNDVIDLTDRTDTACRNYTFSANSAIWGSDHLALFVEVNFPGAGNYVRIGATTFMLEPSGTSGTLSPTDATEHRPELLAPHPASGESEILP